MSDVSQLQPPPYGTEITDRIKAYRAARGAPTTGSWDDLLQWLVDRKYVPADRIVNKIDPALADDSQSHDQDGTTDEVRRNYRKGRLTTDEFQQWTRAMWAKYDTGT